MTLLPLISSMTRTGVKMTNLSLLLQLVVVVLVAVAINGVVVVAASTSTSIGNTTKTFTTTTTTFVRHLPTNSTMMNRTIISHYNNNNINHQKRNDKKNKNNDNDNRTYNNSTMISIIKPVSALQSNIKQQTQQQQRERGLLNKATIKNNQNKKNNKLRTTTRQRFRRDEEDIKNTSNNKQQSDIDSSSSSTTSNEEYVQTILTNYPSEEGYINFSVLIKPAAQINTQDLFTPKANYMLQSVLNTTTKILCQKTQYLYLINNQQQDACGRSSPSKFTTRLNAWNKEIDLHVQDIYRPLTIKSDEWSIGENLLNADKNNKNKQKYIHWLQFSFRYGVLQVGQDVNNEDTINKIVTSMIDYSIQNKEMTQLLRWWNAKILMASPIGKEMEQFVPWSQVFGSWNVPGQDPDENSIIKQIPNSNETKAMMLNPLYQQLNPKPFHTLRVAGILLFLVTIFFVSLMIYLAKKQRIKREEEEDLNKNNHHRHRGNGNNKTTRTNLRTNEGLDQMLDRGKHESMRIRARTSTGVDSPKTKNGTSSSRHIGGGVVVTANGNSGNGGGDFMKGESA